jgi:medium-chain acyl-[acyl-carrier-protein] hydrolase
LTVNSRGAWAICSQPQEAARCRLLCFPFAGGGVSTYRPWGDQLGPDIEVWAVQLPGRDQRRRERPFDRRTPLVRALCDALGSSLSGPLALFGHSMGALVAFEFARERRRRGAEPPVHLFLSARRAPHLPDPDPPAHLLPDDQLMERLRRDRGTPQMVLDRPDLMALFLPVIRADFAVAEAEPVAPGEPLTCPITTFGGLADERATGAELEAWRAYTTGPFTREMFPGNHFFLQSERGSLLRSIARRLAATAGP